MNEKQKEVLKRLHKVEGNHKLKEENFILVNKARMKLYFVAHKTCARSMFVNSSYFQYTNIMFPNPLFVQTYYTNKYIFDILLFSIASRGKRQ